MPKPPGEMVLVEATPEGYKELGRFTPPNGPTDRIVDTKGKGKKSRRRQDVGLSRRGQRPALYPRLELSVVL